MSYPEPTPLLKAPLHKLAKDKSLSKSLSKTTIKPHYQYENETDNIALEQYPISKLTKLGAGSDRIVYDLKDGNVIKISKNARGLLQNSHETPDFYLADLLPRVIETGLDYVVVEKIDIDKKKSKQYLKPLEHLYPKDFENKTSAIQDAFGKMKIPELLNYDILFNDLKRPANWGFRKGKLVLIDAGTLSKDILDKEAQKYFVIEWKKVLMRRKAYAKNNPN